MWSPTEFIGLGTSSPYDVHPDGKRLAIIAAPDRGDAVSNQVVFVLNAVEYLRQIAPAVR